VPVGFDMWRGLLDVSAYDYYNFVMNSDGTLKTWGDADFARKLGRVREHRGSPEPERRSQGLLHKLTECSAAAVTRTSARRTPPDYSPTSRAGITEASVRGERRSKQPFFIWWAPGRAAPRGTSPRRSCTVRRRSRPAPRHAAGGDAPTLAPAAELQRGRPRRQAVQRHRRPAPVADDADIHQLQLDYRRAHRLAARGRRPRRALVPASCARRDSCATP
jgi:hypothetical protein